MDEPDKKRRRMHTGDGSVNRDDGKSTSDYAKVGSATTSKVKIPEAQDIADTDTDDFKIVKTKLTFVDKSKYIKNFFELDESVVGITAPKRFGKSTFMNMLKSFLEITVDENGTAISDSKNSENYKMFMGLQLGVEHPEFVVKHCGQYPTIFMSFRDVGGETEKGILDSVKGALCDAFKKHSYLVETAADGSKSLKNKKLRGANRFLKYWTRARREELSTTDVKRGLTFLSETLHLHFKKKVFVLVDDVDTSVIRAIHDNMDDQLLRDMIRLISQPLSVSLKGNDHVYRALLNSSVRLSSVCLSGSFSSELNNLYDVLFLHDPHFSSVYGFTVEEVHDLLNKEEFQAVKDSEGVEKWYDGYHQTLGYEKTRIYNSWSVINYLRNSVSQQEKIFDSYWAHSDFVGILGKLFVKPQIQEVIEKLLKNETIAISLDRLTYDEILELKKAICNPQHKLTDKQVKFFLQLLWSGGLLNAVENSWRTVTLKIPNWEIKREIQSKCYCASLFETKYKLKPENIQRYIVALENLLEMASDEEETEDSKKKTFQELGDAVAGLFSDDATIPDNESEFHHILFYLAYNSTTFTTRANRAVVMKASEEVEPQCKDKAGTSWKPKEERGRKNEFDMFVILGIVGAILEFKYCKKSESEKSKPALEQIFDKKYTKVFDKDECKHVKTKIYVGLDFNCWESNIKVTMCYLVNSTDLDTAKFVHSPSITETTKADTGTVVK